MNSSRLGLRALSALSVVAAAALTGLAPASAGTGVDSAVSKTLEIPAGMAKASSNGLYLLANSSKWLAQGTRVGALCQFDGPVVALAPNEDAMEVRQIAIDNSNCSTVWERGVPPLSEQQKTTGDSSASGLATEAATTMATNLASGTDLMALAASGSGSGYERAWHTDGPGLTVNSLQSNISWAWNGSCVTSSSGSYNTTWLSNTGWEPPYGISSVISRSCANARVTSAATFKNTGFCWPITVYAYYSGIQVTGGYNGGISGGVSQVQTTGACLPLYEHWQLVRVT